MRRAVGRGGSRAHPAIQLCACAHTPRVPHSPRSAPPPGRGGNRWDSPDGCLMFSACTRLAVPGQWLAFVQYLVSLAVVQAVQAEAAARLPQVRVSCRWVSRGGGSGRAGLAPCGAYICPPPPPLRQDAGIDVRIKWPNDIYAGGLKLGGVLCHSSYRDKLFHIVMGVGLNLANRQPTTCVGECGWVGRGADGGALPEHALGELPGPPTPPTPPPPAACADALIEAAARSAGLPPPPPVPREALLGGVLSRLEPMLQRLAAGGFAPFEAPYYAAWLHSGQRVQLQEGEGQQATWVTVEGLSPHGYLLASDAGVCAHACSRWHAPPRRSTQRHNPPLQSQGASGTSCTRMATAWTFFGGWCAANCQPDRDSGWVCAHRFPLLSHTHTVQQHAIAMQRAGRPQRR